MPDQDPPAPGPRPERLVGHREQAGLASLTGRERTGHRSGLAREDLQIVVEDQGLAAADDAALVAGDDRAALDNLDPGPADVGGELPARKPGRDRIEGLADAHPGPVRLTHGADGQPPRADVPGEVASVGLLQAPVELVQALHLRDRHTPCHHGGMTADRTSVARILVVDDDPRIAASVRRALVYEGYRVEVAIDGPAALAACRDETPDLVVLDRMLPGLDGVEVARRLRAADAGLPILMLTARDAVDDRVAGLDAGADDYLVKPFAYEELLARVRSLLRRHGTSDRQRLAFADVTMDIGAHEVRRNDRVLALSTTAFSLLEHFLRNPRVVLDRDRLLDAVWGTDAENASNVVDVYVGYLRRELEGGGGSRLLHTVRGVGYVLRDG